MGVSPSSAKRKGRLIFSGNNEENGSEMFSQK